MAYSPEKSLGYLCQAAANRRLAHAFLLTGPDQNSKVNLVENFFCDLNQVPTANRHPDFHLIEPESKSRRILVRQIRELEGELRMKSVEGKWKFGLMLDADCMMSQAANAFLKTLEEPPSGSILFLETALPEALLDTVRSRCLVMAVSAASDTNLDPAIGQFLDQVAATRETGVSAALTLARAFQDCMSRVRARIEADHDHLLKNASTAYRQTTDGKWLAEEEDRLAVLTESRYLQARAVVLDRLLEWFGDAIRHAQNFEELDLPAYREATAAWSKQLDQRELLRRFDAINDLKSSLSRNVHEGLALDAGFVEAFGPLLPSP